MPGEEKQQGALFRVQERLRRHFYPQPLIDNPFNPGGDLRWLGQRLAEGYFGTLASLDRSLSMEKQAEPSVERIKDIRKFLKGAFCSDLDISSPTREKTIQAIDALFPKLRLTDRENLGDLTAENIRDLAVRALEDEWQNIGQEETTDRTRELGWTEKAIALSAAYFETMEEHRRGVPFELRSNQLYYMELLLLNPGQYSFGALSTQRRGVELPTGEGKTYAFGLTAAIMAIKGERVHIIEPSYVSAQDHAQQMGLFFEKFLRKGVGVLTDVPEKEGYVLKTRVMPSGLIESGLELARGRKSYLFMNEGLVEQTGTLGRQRAWQCPVVYVDPTSVGFDGLEDTLVGNRSKSGQPPLEGVTALVSEADSVMIDEAANPWRVAREITRDEVWQRTLQVSGLDEMMTKLGFSTKPGQRLRLAQEIFLGLWARLADIEKGYFIEGVGEKHDYFVTQGRVIISEDAEIKMRALLRKMLLERFGSGEESKQVVEKWLTTHNQIVEAAVHIHLGMRPEQEYLGQTTPVLLDEYGFPLEKRQLSDYFDLFLQMKVGWPSWWQEETQALAQLHKVPPERIARNPQFAPELFLRVVDNHADGFRLTEEVERALPVCVFNRYGNLRFSSGSLIPAAESFSDIYQAEVLSVGRHQSIEDIRPPDFGEENALWTRCLDGGIARVDLFDEESNLLTGITRRVWQLRGKGRMALIIVPDIKTANLLRLQLDRALGKRLISKGENPDIVVVTGKEELEKRGSLAKAASLGEPGKIIITTQIASRDFDLDVSPSLADNGGPEVIVAGLTPTERGLWQAIQRVVRGDVPGSRRFMFSHDNLREMEYKHLYYGKTPYLFLSRAELHRRRLNRLKPLFERAFAGDMTARQTVFRETITFLQEQEEFKRLQLIGLYMREGMLGEWRDIFLQKAQDAIDQSPEWQKRILEDGRAEFRKQAGRLKTDTTDLLRRSFGLTLPTPTIGSYSSLIYPLSRGQELQNLWALFLTEIENQFSSFMANPENSRLPPKDLKVKWETYLEGQIPKFIEQFSGQAAAA